MSVLDSINAQRRKDVEQQQRLVSLKQLKATGLYKRTGVSLRDSLVHKGPVAVIAEHKRASPSEGDYNCAASLEEVLKGYENAGVAGISILTEPHRFGGSLEHLTSARSLTKLPLLRKDFIVEAYQVHEAKSAGADAILLIAAGLTLPLAKELAQLAHDLGLEVLLELHEESEFQFLEIRPDIVGINNRNLKTLKIDLKSSIDLFGKIPEEFLKISESGINTPAEAAELISIGYQGLLIGTQFMKTSDPGKSAKNFIDKSLEKLVAKTTTK